MLTESIRRRTPQVVAALFLVVAAVIALAMIPQFRTEMSPGAAPDRGAAGDYVPALLHGTFGCVLLAVSIFRKPGADKVKVVMAGFGVLLSLLLLFCSLIFSSVKTPEMHPTAMLLLACAAADLAGAVTVLAVSLPRSSSLKDVLGRRLWQDVQAHRQASVLFLVYWLASLAVVEIAWNGGIPGPAVLLLFTLPLIAGALVGRWRASTPERATRLAERIRGGMLAGAFSGVITFCVMRGGVVDFVIAWMRGGELPGADLLGFSILCGILGVILGSAGAMFPGSAVR